MSDQKQKIDYVAIEKRREVLEWFHNVQLSKLLENSYKGGWQNESIEQLLNRLEGEINELKEAIQVGRHSEIIRECGDVANFAMFIADCYR